MKSIIIWSALAMVPTAASAENLDHIIISPIRPYVTLTQGIAQPLGDNVSLLAYGVYTDGSIEYTSPTDVTWSITAGSGSLASSPDSEEVYSSSQDGDVVIQARSVDYPAVVAQLSIAVYTPQLSSFFIHPSDYIFTYDANGVMVVTANAIHPFVADTGRDQFGALFPITSPISWSIAPPQHGTIDASGHAILQPGTVDIVAASAGLTQVRVCNVYVPVVSGVGAYSIEQHSSSIADRSTDPIQISAFANDQFGLRLVTQPAFSWSTTPGSDGSVDQNGLFTPFNQDGTAGVIATADGVASSPAQITVAVPNAGFISLDPITVGDWFHTYGRDGWYKPGDDLYNNESSQRPPYYLHYPMTLSAVGSVAPLVYQGTEDTNGRFLATVSTMYDDPATRVVAWWASPTTFTFPIDFSDDTYHLVSFYMVDAEHLGRSEVIQIINPTTGRQIGQSTTISNFQNGVYARFWIKGQVGVRVVPLNANGSVVLGGIFYGGIFDQTAPG